ncbi:MAG: hypothetical protein L6R35_006173 [Caloplaca aegaea]|nr:MAG: hypothetical protein L6R35_006173 [Caloplaca aegaea]
MAAFDPSPLLPISYGPPAPFPHLPDDLLDDPNYAVISVAVSFGKASSTNISHGAAPPVKSITYILQKLIVAAHDILVEPGRQIFETGKTL